MSERNGDSPLISVAKNEYVLLLFRLITSGCALIMTWWLLDLKTDTKEIRRDFNASLVMNEARISKLEGTMSVIDNSIRMQSRVIETHENAIQAMYNRIYDLNRNTK